MSAEMDGVHPYPVSAGRRKSNPAAMRARGRIGAHTRWAHESDRVAATQPMRDAMQRKFEDEVDPDRVLAPDELERRVANAKSAYFTRLAMKSAAARAARKSA